MIRSLMRSRPTSRSRKKELCYSELFSEWCEWWRSCKLIHIYIYTYTHTQIDIYIYICVCMHTLSCSFIYGKMMHLSPNVCPPCMHAYVFIAGVYERRVLL